MKEDWEKDMEDLLDDAFSSPEKLHKFLDDTGFDRYHEEPREHYFPELRGHPHTRTEWPSKCEPETCDGSCQGMGTCQLCIDFREEHGIRLPTLEEMCDLGPSNSAD